MKKLLFFLFVVLLPLAVACNKTDDEEEMDGASIYDLSGTYQCTVYKLDWQDQPHDGLYITFEDKTYTSNIPFIGSSGTYNIVTDRLYLYYRPGEFYIPIKLSEREPRSPFRYLTMEWAGVTEDRKYLQMIFFLVKYPPTLQENGEKHDRSDSKN